MKVTCLQMSTPYRQPDVNYSHAEELIAQAMEEKPDVLVLPETWNTGFYIKDGMESYCDQGLDRVKAQFGALARKYQVNIIAGSVSNIRDVELHPRTVGNAEF